MDFDFFSLKILAESQSSDEVILGFFFGKVEGRLDFQFINFARRFKDIAKINLNKDLNDFKEDLNSVYRKLIARSGDILTRTNDFTNYLKSYINKNGGRLNFSNRLSSIVGNKDTDSVRALLRDVFDEWTSDLKINFECGCSTYSEMSSEESSKTENTLQIQEALENAKDRKELLDLSDFYPIVDPMEGNQAGGLKVGDSIFITIIQFSNETDQQRLMGNYPDKFDAKGKNNSPFEGYITAMEYISAEKGTILLKIVLDDWFEAKAFIMSNIRIMQKNRRKNILRDHSPVQDILPNELPKKSSERTESDHINQREKLFDQLLVASLMGLITIVVLIIIFILL
ncbi:MAG TPA: DUF4899 domain-containing protein [Bacteroidales bacterium]|nr:DUF4899 domain-containing protein [Bacteroidales bacterium]HRW33593.1 DUF4899 domain-containing protein [Thermotogota bacterium]